MSLINCPECGKEISDLAENCPNCGFPIKSNDSLYSNMPSNNYSNASVPSNDNVNANMRQSYGHSVAFKPYEPEAKNSKLGIVALILSILGCTFWLGIILAIIDLCKKDGSKKVCSIVAICVSAFWLVLAVGVGGTGNDSKTQKTNSTATTSTVSTQDTSASSQQAENYETTESEENEATTEQQDELGEYIEITSSELIDIYNKNQVKCKQLYDGKLLMVTGSVKSVGTDILDHTYVCLDHDTEYVFVGIQCFAKDIETENKIAELKEGDIITVIGDGECGSMSFSLKNAEILNMQDQSGSESRTEDDSSLTTSQRNALKSANSYLNFSAFSYEGLISQLEFEEYSHEDAVYAADNCGADWNEQALKTAKNYLEYSAFSHSGLVAQLEYEKFTSDQAKYGADNCGADWDEQAAKAAKSYLDFTSFSKDGLIEQLEYEGFTHEQAEYGATANGY